MTAISIRTFVAMELQRLGEWLDDSPDSLDAVETARTIGDCIRRADLQSRLPDGWSVDCEIVQFPDESLAEVIRITGRNHYQITLKPADIAAPTDRVSIYTRRSPTTARRHHDTVRSLSQALAALEQLATTREAARERSTASAPVGRHIGT